MSSVHPASEPVQRVAATANPRNGSQRFGSQVIADTLRLVGDILVPQRRVVHAGDKIYPAGASFGNLYVVNTGSFKLVSLSADGREQVVALKMRGDWLGFDGIADGRYACDAVAMDTGEVWVFRYEALLAAAPHHPELMRAMHEAMSRDLGRERDFLMSVCTLPADARVAEFLRDWAESLARRGLRTDQITLRMTRAEIGNHLGMTLESVSRALSRLAKGRFIAFAEKGRRDISIPVVDRLAAFVQASLTPASALLQ